MKEKVKELISLMNKEIEENKKSIIEENDGKVREMLSTMNDVLEKGKRILAEFDAVYSLGHILIDATKECEN